MALTAANAAFARLLDCIRLGDPLAADLLRDYCRDFVPMADSGVPFGAAAEHWLSDGLLDAQGSA